MAVVFERIELDYGRHGGVFRLVPPDPVDPAHRPGNNGSGNGTSGPVAGTGRPFVILGPNGAGKSTLMEAPVRALFGFRRNRKEGREAHGQRKPWIGGPYRALVSLKTDAGRYTFERDFETDRIRVTEAGRQAPMFDAEANPSRTGESVRQYRQILRDVVGLDNFDHYRDTACVFQGGLLATGLSVELLRVAAGGHTDVESAHARLRQEYGAITVDPIAPGVARRRKPGQLERLGDTIEELELEVAEARASEERRTPLVRAREGCVVRHDALALEIGRLETAFETLSEGARLETEAEATRARIRGLESAEHELDEALARFGLLVDREQAHGARYPLDFAERARALEEGLWPNLANVEAESERLADLADAAVSVVSTGPWSSSVLGAVAAVVLATTGMGLALAGLAAAGVATLVLGVGGGVYIYTRRRGAQLRSAFRTSRLSELAAERAGLVERIERLTADVPDGGSLRAETLAAARREFEREEADRRLHSDSEGVLRQAMDAAGRAITLHEADREDRDMPPAPGGDAPPARNRDEDAHRDTAGLPDRARLQLRALREASARERDDEMAPLRLRLNEIAKARFDLPDGVEPDLESVRLARRDRLARAGEAQAELSAIERDLAAEGRVTASVLSLERELAERRTAAAAVQARAAAYRHAYAFVADAYEAFRTTDEDRLLGAISAHLAAVSAGAMGPIEAAGGLDEATVRSAERSLPLSSPPLSYGQLHAALLSVRMGAADFLAGLGVGLPLLLDDPFVHLDDRAVSDLWTVLQRIATDRQVIVATQDRLVLDHLGVTPDLELDRPGVAPRHEPSDVPRIGEGILDLWDDPAN
jgi:DNA repair exonuclease SbcCD ATPase subunit